MRDPLLDQDFLLKLDQERNREIYIKITALNFEEDAIEEINGRIQSGSINIDGASAVRRTCSLSIIANELDIHQYYWGLRTKFKCAIGIGNNIDDKYPEVIWFPMGTYLITSFNTSQGINSYTISISGKDKMALLNGDLGGTITAISVDFGQITEQAIDGSISKKKLLLKDIIREAVKEYAHEPEQNIIINDMDDTALELLEYRGKDALYLIKNNKIDEITNTTLDGNQKYWTIDPNSHTPTQVQLKNIDDKTYILDHRISLNFENRTDDPTKFYASSAAAANQGEDFFTICKAEYGDVIGYRETDFVYAGDLISSIGSSVTSMLDNIKNMLGDYEYFYNLDGQFVWQRKPTFVNVSWNNLTQNEGDKIHGENSAYTSAITYSFENHNMISSFQNSPNLLNIKNDYSVFGQKTLSNGTQIPVHIRYAIDNKPTMYRDWNGVLYATDKVDEEDLRIIDVKLATPEDIAAYMESQFERSPNPPGLSDDWWDVWEWGEYYKFLTGEYPNQSMSDYATDVTYIDLESMFEAELLPPFAIPNYSRGSWINVERPCFLFDTWTVNGITYLGFTGHNPYNASSLHSSCGHRYNSYFMQKYRDAWEATATSEDKYDFHAYFYKPTIPDAVIDDILKEELSVKVRETPIIVDWRELIYRMASDYMKHGTDPLKNYEPVKVISQAQLNNGLYFIKKDSYYRATEYIKEQTYYQLTSNGYQLVTLNADTNFATNAYYYKVSGDKYEVATVYKSDTQYYTYVDFLYRIRTYNDKMFPRGITGYEQYYTDMMSFWRDLYNPDYVGTFKVVGVNKQQYYKNGAMYYWFKNQEGLSYDKNVIYYTQDLYGNWRAHKNIIALDFAVNSKYYFLPIAGKNNVTTESGLQSDYVFKADRTYYTKESGEYYPQYQLDVEGNQIQHPRAFWNTKIFTDPEDITFWFDFLDTDGDLSQYSVPRIGDRPKTENNTNIKTVYNRETPNVIFANNDEEVANLKVAKPGYSIFKLNNTIDYLFRISTQKQSCQDKLNELLYQYTVAGESITINAIPIYYLQPNTRIYVTDENSNINGEYIVSKIGFQLSHSGMMSISATKSIDRIY